MSTSDGSHTTPHVVELIARDLCADFYAELMGMEHDHPAVQAQVDEEWHLMHLTQARAVLASLEAHGCPVPEGWEVVHG